MVTVFTPLGLLTIKNFILVANYLSNKLLIGIVNVLKVYKYATYCFHN